MDKADETGQERKPKVCRFAILSPLVAILGFLLAIAQIPYGSTIFIVSMAAALLLGVISCWKTYKSKGTLKNYVFSSAGIVLTAIILAPVLLPSLFCPRPCAVGTCSSNIAALGMGILIYAYNDSNGRYPAPEAWCDLLIEGANVSKEQFLCSSALKTGDEGPCHYAINPNCGPNSPADTVLLFETKGGWNQYGGPELLTVEHHEGKGCNILFNDTRVSFIRTEQIGELKWGEK